MPMDILPFPSKAYYSKFNHTIRQTQRFDLLSFKISKSSNFFHWLTQSCCTEWRQGTRPRRCWPQAMLYKPCPRRLQVLKQGRTRRDGATRSRLGRRRMRRRTRHRRVVGGRVRRRRRIGRGDSRRPRLKRGGRWGVKSEFDDDQTAAVEEEAVENRTAEMKWGCNVGDGARTSGGAPLVPFRVVVTLSETERFCSLCKGF